MERITLLGILKRLNKMEAENKTLKDRIKKQEDGLRQHKRIIAGRDATIETLEVELEDERKGMFE